MKEPAASHPERSPQDARWLAGFCLARALFSMSQTTYAASLPLLKTDWQMSASQAGLISSAFYFGFLISLFVVGFMADRIGAKRTYLGTSLLAAVSALVFAAFARDFLSAFILYGLTGLFAGGSYTPGLAILAQRFPSRGRGRAIGFYIAASSAGYAGSLLLSSAVLSVSGWQAAFFATCLGPTLGMVVGAWVLRGTPNVTLPPASPERTEGNLFQAVVGNKPALLIILAYTFHSWEVLGLWAWTPFYLSVVFAGESGAAVAASAGAGFTALAYLVAVGGPIVGGSLSDRLGRTTVILLMSITSVACSFSIGWLLTAPFWLVVVLSFVYQFTAIGDSPVLSTGLSELVPPRYLGSAYSLRSVLGFGAGSISPWVYGVVLDWGRGGPAASPLLAFGLAFSAFGMVGVLCPLCAYWLRRLPGSARMAGGLR